MLNFIKRFIFMGGFIPLSIWIGSTYKMNTFHPKYKFSEKEKLEVESYMKMVQKTANKSVHYYRKIKYMDDFLFDNSTFLWRWRSLEDKDKKVWVELNNNGDFPFDTKTGQFIHINENTYEFLLNEKYYAEYQESLGEGEIVEESIGYGDFIELKFEDKNTVSSILQSQNRQTYSIVKFDSHGRFRELYSWTYSIYIEKHDEFKFGIPTDRLYSLKKKWFENHVSKESGYTRITVFNELKESADDDAWAIEDASINTISLLNYLGYIKYSKFEIESYRY